MSDGWLLLAVGHLTATAFMAGLIWTIQVVHYPLFALVGKVSYPEFQRAHMARISRLLVLPWGAEALTMIGLVLAAPSPRLRWWSIAGAGLFALVVLVTAAVAAPAHNQLTAGFDPERLGVLLRANWLRTALWTARVAVATGIVWISVTG